MHHPKDRIKHTTINSSVGPPWRIHQTTNRTLSKRSWTTMTTTTQWTTIRHQQLKHYHAFIIPVVDHWLEREIAQWVSYLRCLCHAIHVFRVVTIGVMRRFLSFCCLFLFFSFSFLFFSFFLFFFFFSFLILVSNLTCMCFLCCCCSYFCYK